jgi:large subunit ribosomal protein L21
MYAVVDIGGKQAKVEPGTLVAVEKIDAEVGATVNLRVLTIADGDRLLAKPADVANATVTAEVVEHFLGDKQVVFKFQKRKGYKRTKGHRQMLTNVRITDIVLDGKPAAKPAKAEAAPKKEAAPKAEAAPKKEAAPKAEKPVKAEAPKAEVPAAEKQCAAIKSDGTQCANKAKEGSDYCGVHAKKYEG